MQQNAKGHAQPSIEQNFTERKIEFSENPNSTETKNGFSANKEKLTISSLEISELTGKSHFNLLRDIRSMEPAWTKITKLKFDGSEYTDITGRTLPMYEFNKLEYMYVISKFSDEIRAALVVRWYQLETERLLPKKRIRLHSHEKPLFDILNRWLVKGDIKKVALKLEVTAPSVSRVKRGVFRSQRIMEALIEQCRFNKENNVTEGYVTKQLTLNFFNQVQIEGGGHE